MQRVQRMANKAMKDYEMLQDGDRIMIGLSGGKDSLALVEVLAARQKIFKPKIEVVACHVSVENVPYQSDIEYLREFCESRGVKFVHKTTRFDEDTKDGRGPCFLCAWNRRKTLFKAAEEQGCTKLALGHHKDDILETLLMNQIFQGAYATMPPVLKMAKFDMTIIRPLCLVPEADIVEYAKLRELKKQIKNCPYEQDSNRHDMQKVMDLLEKMNPEARHSLWGAMTNIQSDYLPILKDE